MYVFLAPLKLPLKVTESLNVTLLPLELAELLARLIVHCVFDSVPLPNDPATQPRAKSSCNDSVPVDGL
jgi:hypothetical protein